MEVWAHEASAPVLAAHRTEQAVVISSPVTVAARAAAGARARGGVLHPLPRGSCKVEASVHGPEEGEDGSGGGAAVLMIHRNGASRHLLPYFVSCVV
ncbi:hypothetical protein BAE44_0007872 [Dichanthelium oligosanthes]|uniref:Uncharacterized protein n=1 Tax=Dichanthelium oligosanthes TaxID=888268 RepID=A0A1E5W198_9POAL|nr:hypothetical protein BAE44_0007872 [Dichanthelium oligosanthes]